MAYTGGRSRVSNAWAPQRAGKGRRRAPRARDGDGPVGEMSERRAARRAAASLTLGWLASPVYHSQQSKIGSCGWCVGSRRGVQEEEAVRSSRMTAWRQVARLGSICTLEFFLQSGANCRISIIQTLTNTLRSSSSVTHLAAPRKTYAPPRRPGTGKTYSETGRHAWGERTRPPKFIGKNRTYTRRCGVAMWLSKPAGGWRACGGTRGKAAPRCR